MHSNLFSPSSPSFISPSSPFVVPPPHSELLLTLIKQLLPYQPVSRPSSLCLFSSFFSGTTLGDYVSSFFKFRPSPCPTFPAVIDLFDFYKFSNLPKGRIHLVLLPSLETKPRPDQAFL